MVYRALLELQIYMLQNKGQMPATFGPDRANTDFPAAQTCVTFRPGAAYNFSMPDSALNILLIDDDQINNFITSKLIKKVWPYAEITTCLNGRQAIDLLLSRKREPALALPEYILLDLNMPVMDGWEFLEEYTAEYRAGRRTEDIRLVFIRIQPRYQ